MESVTLKGDFSVIKRVGTNQVVLEGFINGRESFYRTYGLKRQFGYEIEFNLSIHPSEAERLLDYIVNKLICGITFEENVPTSELTGAPVLPIMIEPKVKYFEDEKILRIVFSDENFKLPSDEDCHPAYAKQMN